MLLCISFLYSFWAGCLCKSVYNLWWISKRDMEIKEEMVLCTKMEAVNGSCYVVPLEELYCFLFLSKCMHSEFGSTMPIIKLPVHSNFISTYDKWNLSVLGPFSHLFNYLWPVDIKICRTWRRSLVSCMAALLLQRVKKIAENHKAGFEN